MEFKTINLNRPNTKLPPTDDQRDFCIRCYKLFRENSEYLSVILINGEALHDDSNKDYKAHVKSTGEEVDYANIGFDCARKIGYIK